MADMKLRHGCVLGCGVLHVLFAIAMIICGILLLVWNSIAGPFAVGFWGGFWVLITGVVGVVGGLMKKKGLEIAFLVLSILNCVFFWWIIALISGLTGIIENGCENTNNIMPSVEQMINTAQYGYGVMETALTDATNLITRKLGDTPYPMEAVTAIVCGGKNTITGATPNEFLNNLKTAVSMDWKIIHKNGGSLCVCTKGYDNMYGAEITLLGIGLTLLLVGILSASFACCAVCRCCGAIDSAAVVPIDPKVTVVTTSNGYNFQQVAQPVSYVNGQPIDNKYGQQPFAQQPFVQQPFAQQPFAQQPIVPPTYDQFNQSQQSLKSSMTNVPATLDSFAPVVVA